MSNVPTSLTLIALTLLTLAAWVLALRRLRHPEMRETASAAQQWLVAIVGLGSAAVFIVRWVALHGNWQPVEAHVDGLALIGALFAGCILYIQNRRRLVGLSAFALPLLALLLAWGVCAAAWTYHPFDLPTLHSVWRTVHLLGVYLGTCFAALGAIAGGMFLYVQNRLKHKHGLKNFGRLASLEALETLIIRAATLGFALLTLGLISGLVVLSDADQPLFPGWWYGPKIVLALASWAAYALVMNVRYGSRFRGARAAWLAIVGLVLLLTVYGIVTALPHDTPHENTATQPTAIHHPPSAILQGVL